jgi:hypothetical protein
LKSEHFGYTLDASHENVNLFLCIIEGKRSTDSARDAQTIHQGLGTVMTGAYGDAQTIEERAHIEVVDMANVEGYDSVFID